MTKRMNNARALAIAIAIATMTTGACARFKDQEPSPPALACADGGVCAPVTASPTCEGAECESPCDADYCEPREGDLWSATRGEVGVCWQTSDDARSRDIVRLAVSDSWERIANVRFVGWETCDSHDASPIVRMEMSGHADPAAADVYVAAGRSAALRSGSAPRFEIGRDAPRARVEQLAVHAFGHVLGYRHRGTDGRRRLDIAASCVRNEIGGAGRIGAVMDECPAWTEAMYDDANWAQRFYGDRLPSPDVVNPDARWAPNSHVAAVSCAEDSLEAFLLGTDGQLWSAGTLSSASATQGATAWRAPEALSRPGRHRWSPGRGIAAVSRSPASLETFVLDDDGLPWVAGALTRDARGETWSEPRSLGATMAERWPGAAVTAVRRDARHLETFVIDGEGRLWSAGSWTDGPNGGAWTAPYPLPSQARDWAPGGAVAAVSRRPDMIELFTIGRDGAPWSAGTWRSGGDGRNWGPPSRIGYPDNFTPGLAVAAVARTASTVDLFVPGIDHRLYAARLRDGAGTRRFLALTQTEQPGFGSAPGLAVVARTPTQLDLLYVGTDGTLRHASYLLGSP